MKKATKEFCGELLVYGIIAIIVFALVWLITWCIGESAVAEASAQATESLDMIDREYFIEYLSQTKGKIETIRHLSDRVNADEEVLFTELTNIIESANGSYFGEDSPMILLRDFTLVAPDDTSDIRNYCEILIEQLENQISDIRFGKADA